MTMTATPTSTTTAAQDERQKLLDATIAALPPEWFATVGRAALDRALDMAIANAPKIAADAVAAAIRAQMDAFLATPEIQKQIGSAAVAAASSMLDRLRG